MAAAFCRSGQISPTNLNPPLEKVFDDAQHTGQINLVGRKLKEYPRLADKYDLVDTSSADLSRNSLHEIPPAVCDYRSMERLVCYHNVIRCLPDAILQLQCLSYLNLSCNQLSHIPPFICRIQSLEVLVVSNNRLVSIPEELGRLDNLTELDVSCNEINVLPSQLGELESLRVLNVRKNLLVELPTELSRLKLRKLDFSCNKIGIIPPEYRLMETLDTLIVDHNPLTSPPAHICTKGRVHIMKYLQIEAIKEDKKRGLIGDNDLRRYFRKSASQQKAMEELTALNSHHLDPGGEIGNQRDSGYMTTEEKPHWNGVSKLAEEMPAPPPYPGRPNDLPQQNGSPSPRQTYKPKFTPPSPQFNHTPTNPSPVKGHVLNATANQNGGRGQATPVTPGSQAIEEEFPPPPDPEVDEFTRELQRQKSEYEARKKKAELLRRQREGEQKVQQEQIVSKVLEERSMDGRVPSVQDVKEPTTNHVQTDEKSFVEQQREEARKRLEEKTRNRHRPDKLPLSSNHRSTPSKKPLVVPDQAIDDTARLPPPPVELLRPTVASSPPNSLPLTSVNVVKAKVKQPPAASAKPARKPSAQHARSSSDTRMLQHVRTASDASLSVVSESGASVSSTLNRPMYAAPMAKNKRTHDPYQTHSLPRSPPKHARQSQTKGKLRDGPVSPPPVPRNQSNPLVSIPDAKSVARRSLDQSHLVKERSDPVPSAVAPPAGLQRQMSEPDSRWISEASRPPVGQHKQDGEFLNRHEALMRQTHQEASTIRRKIEDEKDRLLKMKKEPLYNYLTKKSEDESNIVDAHNTSQSSVNSNSSLPSNGKEAFNVRLPEELRYINPNFTVRRQFEQAREEMEQIDRLRRDIESRLKVQLPADVPAALKDGIVLCHLANYVRPRSVSSIHVPPPSATSLSIGKCRRNVENFLEACRKIGVEERDICSAAEILEERGVMAVAHTVHQLLNLNNPEASNV